MTPAQRIQSLINLTHKHATALKQQLANLTQLNAKRRAALQKLVPPIVLHPASEPYVTMYDDVTISLIPPSAKAVAGYVNGQYANFSALKTRFPNAKHVSIATDAAFNADCLDVETGDATPAQAPAWVARQLKLKPNVKPKVYANRSTMPSVKAALMQAGFHPGDVLLWVAEYTYKAHIPNGFDACQWTDQALGRSLDASMCKASFFD